VSRVTVSAAVIMFAAALLSSMRARSSTPYPGIDEQPAQAHFDYDPLSLPAIVVRVRINDHQSLPFLLDTGLNNPMLIANWAARRMNLAPSGHTITVSPGNFKMTRAAVDATIPGTSGSMIALDSHTAYVGALPNLEVGDDAPVLAGIIGAPMLEGSTWTFDFSTKTLTRYHGSHTPAPGDQFTTLPMREEYHNYLVHARLPEGVDADLLIDTGSTSCCIASKTAARMHSLSVIPGILSSAGGLEVTDEMLFPRVGLGDLTEPQVVMYSAPDPDGACIGLDLLSRFRVTLDFPGRKLTLERAADYGKRLRLDGSAGIDLGLRPKGFFVDHVDNDLPEMVRSHVGDRVLEIDGRSLSGLDLASAQSLLSGYAGTDAKLLLLTAGQQRVEVRVLRESEFDGDPDPVVGLALSQSTGGLLLVSSVQSGSPADQAGIRRGDEVVAVNGVSPDRLTPPQLGRQLRSRRVSLTLAKGDDPLPRVVVLSAPLAGE